MSKQLIYQPGYGSIEIDDSEKDAIQLRQGQKEESNVVFVERDMLDVFIELLQNIKKR
jgi:hypothetical protein